MRSLLLAVAVSAAAFVAGGLPASADLANRPPDRPTNLRTDPPLPVPCRWCDGKSYVHLDQVRLIAKLSDPDSDPVQPLWQISADGVVESRPGFFLPSGAIHDTFVDLRGRNGKQILWWVHGVDGRAASEPAIGQGPFVVDRTGVDVAPTVSSTDYPDDNQWHGGPGVPGTFTFGANGVGDIDHYLYGWSDPPTTKVDADALGGNASVTIAPPVAGPQNQYVVSVDRAGHRSPTRVHHFFVAPTTR